jgi:hypothetical protein
MPSMRRWLTRLFAIAVGAVVFGLTFVLNEIGTNLLYRLVYQRWTEGQSNFGLVTDYQRVGLIFYFGYPLAVGIATIFFFWNGLPKQAFRISLYLLLLAVVGPLTFINYMSSDQLINLWIQSAFNLFVAFVGYVIVLRVRSSQPSSLDGKALQSISILLIASLVVALPLFYTGIFLSVALHLMSHEQVGKIPDSVPGVVAGLAGTAGVLLTSLQKLRTDKAVE